MSWVLNLLALPGMTTFILFIRIIISVKNAPYIGDDNGSKDSLCVYSWVSARIGGGFYRKFVFKKKQNGKYRLKYSVWDIFCMLFLPVSIIACIALNPGFWIDGIKKYPDIVIPFTIFFLISIIEFYLLCIYSQIDARRHLSKYLKGFNKPDDKNMVKYDPSTQYAVIISSICTGEKVAGFKNKIDGHFTGVMLIKTPKDEKTFKEMYGLDDLPTEY